MDEKKLEDLNAKATQIRKYICEMTCSAGSGHPGGALSSADIITVLYFDEMRYDPNNLCNTDRDRFVLSKGHSCPAQYAAMALAGMIPEKELFELRRLGSRLRGHPSCRVLDGIEITTGSLGQGLSVMIGMGLASKIDKNDYNIYGIIGDGESQEGQIWEAAMAAGHYKLDNICCFLDYNKQQIDGNVADIMDIAPVVDKWRSFNWNVIEIDGHDIVQIREALNVFKKEKSKPTMIVANTIKGKGISFMECNLHFHGNAPKEEELEKALQELS